MVILVLKSGAKVLLFADMTKYSVPFEHLLGINAGGFSHGSVVCMARSLRTFVGAEALRAVATPDTCRSGDVYVFSR